MFSRFYTYPPLEGWKWVLRNIKQKPIPCTHEIVDIGIYDLLKPPFKHSIEKLEKWDALQTEGWKVVPDCPDLQGEFSRTILKKLMKIKRNSLKRYNDLVVQINRFIDYWWNYLDDFDNTEYSWQLLRNHFDMEDEHQIPVIQSKYEDLNSFKEYISNFKEFYGEYDKIAIGSIFKADNNSIALKMLKITRREFPNSWIHAFGLRFKQFIKARHLINSFDSTSWTFPRESGKSSCKNKMERIEYFKEYTTRIEQVMYPYNENQTKLEI